MKNLYILILALLQTASVFAQSGWQSQLSGTNQRLHSVHFTSSSTGWSVGNAGTILMTTNGGDNWLPQSSGTSSNLYSVYFTSSSTGWATGADGTLLKTINGGDNWISQPIETSEYLHSVNFVTSVGWIVGSNGIILKTTNGGSNWFSQTSGTTDYLFSVHSRSTSTVWAVGGSTLSRVILKSTNGGTNWFFQDGGGGAGLFSVFFSSLTTGCAVGSFGTILFTTNGGTNWNSNTLFGAGEFISVYLISSTTGWFSGTGKIYKTTSGGTQWMTQVTNNSNIFLSDIHFATESTGWAVGTQGTILKTTNGGTSSFTLNLTALIEGFYDESSGFMKGDTVNASIAFQAFQPPLGVEPAKGYLDSTGHCTFTFYNADHTTPFYFYVNHRNSIETWTSNTMMFSSFALNYDFTTAASQAAGNNMILKGAKYCIYSGDVNQDDAVDINDAALVDNDLYIFAAGSYLITDLNGDEIVDVSDALVVDNNAFNVVEVIYPWSMRTH